MRKLILALMTIGCTVVAGAAPALAAAAGVDAFCRANVAVDAAAEGPNPRLLQRLADTVDAAVATFGDEGEAAFEDPTFQSQISDIDQFVIDECGYRAVDVTMRDYAFDGIPKTLKKGVVAFDLRNEGTEVHEFTVGRLKGNATLDDLLKLPDDASEKAVGKLMQPVPGGGFAFPGDTDLALITLTKPGRYVALCFIPVGSTPEAGDEGGSGPPHFHEGMAAQFRVKS